MTRLRARVAERLKGAQNTFAMLTTFNEVDMTNLMKLRADFKVTPPRCAACQSAGHARENVHGDLLGRLPGPLWQQSGPYT